jgi:hypothetical protein
MPTKYLLMDFFSVFDEFKRFRKYSMTVESDIWVSSQQQKTRLLQLLNELHSQFNAQHFLTTDNDIVMACMSVTTRQAQLIAR